MKVKKLPSKDQTSRAEGKIRTAKDRLLVKYPFHIAVLSQMPVVSRPSVETMAVTISDDRVFLLHNPTFVLDITIPELIGVLIHEVHHVIFNHLTMKREDYPHHPALIIAQEVTVNEFIEEPLPGEPILLKDFPELKPRESTNERYNKLKKTIDPGGKYGPLDDHSLWALDPNGTNSSTIQQLLAEAVASCNGNIPDELKDLLSSLGIGTEPGYALERITKGGNSRIRWQTELQRYLGSLLEIRPKYNRPPRRFPDMVGIIPAQTRSPGKPKVMAVIDTSGSITSGLLTIIDSELKGLVKHYTVTVVECDVVIHRVYPYKSLDHVQGRGGTNLCPPFENKFLQKHKPDVLIYFTDGYGPAPKIAPKVPTVWCILPCGVIPVNWGKRIQMV